MTTTAIRVHATGGPDQLILERIPTPEPGPGTLLVEVAVAGVNFIDVYLRRGIYPAPLPLGLGKEGVGHVLAVGDGVDGFTVGDRIAWSFGDGSYATHTLVPAANAVHVPEDVDDRTAAAVILQGLTAHFLLTSIVELEPGDSALVHAGAGGVGLLLTQMLKLRGVQVATTVSTSAKAALSREAGADVVLPYEGFAAAVREATDGKGVRVVFDGVGADTFDQSLDALATRGHLVLFGASSGPVPPFDPQVLNRKGSLSLTRPSLGHFIADRDELDWRAEDLFALVSDGRLNVRIGAEYPLAEAAEAHRALEGRLTTGKVLLIP